MFNLLVSMILLLQGIPVQQDGSVTGVLRDAQGLPLAGVRMAAVARGTSIEETATGAAMAGLAQTDEQGRFVLEDIPPGRYSIAAGRLDLQTYYPGTQSLVAATVLTITAGETITGINFALNSTSVGRASNFPIAVPRITATIPVRVQVENGGKLPVSADGKLITLRLDSPSSSPPLTIPIKGVVSFLVPGPGPADFRLVVENLPDIYEVKSIRYGSAVAAQGVFRLSAANFPSLTPAPPTVVSEPAPPQGPAATQTALDMYQAALAAYTIARNQIAVAIAPFTTLIPATTAPSVLSLTIGEAVRPTPPGVRVSGKTGSLDTRSVYISGRPGVMFSDGTFEFRGVPPGRHLIAALGAPDRSAAVLVVGDKDVNDIELKQVFLLPDDVRQPKDPMPAGDLAPGTIVPLARIAGTVVAEQSRTPIPEGQVVIRSGDYSRNFPIDAQGRFETFTLLPGTYDIRFQIFGHSTIGPTVLVEDKEIDLEVSARRLY